MEFKIINLTDKKCSEINTTNKQPAFLVAINDSPYQCSIYDNLDSAKNAILSHMLDYEKLIQNAGSVWVENGVQTVYLRVPHETLKKYPFQRICNDSSLYEIKYKIHAHITNTPIPFNNPYPYHNL